MIVLLDNGHGEETAGKRSPDGRLREYAYAREIVKMLKDALADVPEVSAVHCITPEEADINLNERVRRANAICRATTEDVLLISVHCNAAGADGRWHHATGWSDYVSHNASQKSKQLATCLTEATGKCGLTVRRYSAQQSYFALNLAICRDTVCPAVLTENMFMDNIDDVEYLLSYEGKRNIVQIHVNGIVDYINSLKS